MLLTITATRSETLEDARDLGFLLHKHPDRVQSSEVVGGTATVLYPESEPERCTFALLLEVDPIDLVRGRKGRDSGFALAQYVNDRPYVASSLLSVAMGKLLRTALNGVCNARPDLVDATLDLQVMVPTMPGGADLQRRLFAPLGWDVAVEPTPLDPQMQTWGEAPHTHLTLTGTMRLKDALNHLYVLIPVLDGAKHYWVHSDEVEKLVRAGGGWLGAHPEREEITRRYLARQRDLADAARERLDELDGTVTSSEPPRSYPSLARRRQDAVAEVVEGLHPATVVDLGCGEGALLRTLMPVRGIERLVGTEVSARSLEVAAKRLHVDGMTERQSARLELVLSSLQYHDERLEGFDVAVLMEVVEHIDEDRLPALVANVFGRMTPGAVVVTTPNREYNVHYPGLVAGAFRHGDHRFEWSREEFESWASDVAARFGYDVRHHGIGDEDPAAGSPTQMAVFRRRQDAA